MRRIEMPPENGGWGSKSHRRGITIHANGKLWISHFLYENWCDQVGMHLTVVSELALIRFFRDQAQENQ